MALSCTLCLSFLSCMAIEIVATCDADAECHTKISHLPFFYLTKANLASLIRKQLSISLTETTVFMPFVFVCFCLYLLQKTFTTPYMIFDGQQVVFKRKTGNSIY